MINRCKPGQCIPGVYLGESSFDPNGIGWYWYSCANCGNTIMSKVAPESICKHQNIKPIRKDVRKTQCGKEIPCTIWYCDDCQKEFSLK